MYPDNFRTERSNMMKVLLVLLSLVAAATAQAGYEFSAGYLEVLGGEPSHAFSCEGRSYGYYADVANNCEVFHVCLPIEDDFGEITRTAQYSFFCGNQTVFSQDSLTCSHPEDAYPCSEAEGYYDIVNAEFGRIPEDTDY